MLKELIRFLDKNSPTILTTLGVVGVVTTSVSAGQATIKATKILEDAGPIKDFKNWDKDKKLQIVKDLGVIYAPTIIMGAATVTSIIFANRIASKRTAVLASLYSLSEKALDNYKLKADEIIGAKKMQKVKDEVEYDRLIPMDQVGSIYNTGHGNSLFFNTFDGRYFRSDIEYVRKVINDLNFELLNSMFVSLNEFYADMGLERSTIGDMVGWTIENQIMPRYTCRLMENEEPCTIVTFDVDPKYDFNHTW